MKDDNIKLTKCFESIKKKLDFQPEVGLVLGSGLGDYASEIKIVSEIDYKDIKGFPVSTVPGHSGKFVFGYVGDVKVVCMKGRIHYYEGYDMGDVVLPIRMMIKMGIKALFLTNACGGINPSFQAGDFMLIRDHISCFVPNPLIGKNLETLGPRFPDMSHVYDEKLSEVIRNSAKEQNLDLKEGVYLQYSGPTFETPAEIKMFGLLGADVVGMSTAVEATAANHAGVRVCGVSFISNKAAGLSKIPLTHEEVQEAANAASSKFKALVTRSIIGFKTEFKTKLER
ncbi:MAG TPA: purine-nucleoside phosphorylase [Acholeplasmatales bacterium]|nr:purine-nucleoside phosphorylase [Acholeplasmatales bacterium]